MFLIGRQLPTLGGACVYRWVKDALSEGPSMMEVVGGPAPLIVGFVVAMVSAALAIKWLVHYLTRHGFALFGWYRLALCAALAALWLLGVVDVTPG